LRVANRARTAIEGGITAARALRDELLAGQGRGERVAPNPRLRFGEAADRWLAGPVVDLRETTQAGYRNAVERHLRPRYATRRLDTIDPDALAVLVRTPRSHVPRLCLRAPPPRVGSGALVAAPVNLVGLDRLVETLRVDRPPIGERDPLAATEVAHA
jgi:hypothetical protein